jgi:hypothetical protein
MDFLGGISGTGTLTNGGWLIADVNIPSTITFTNLVMLMQAEVAVHLP